MWWVKPRRKACYDFRGVFVSGSSSGLGRRDGPRAQVYLRPPGICVSFPTLRSVEIHV